MKSSELVMLQEVWRKARREGGLLLEFKTPGGAQRARMQLYNAVKLQKAGKDLEDYELVKAAEQIEIVWANEGRTALRMQPKDDSDSVKSILEALGAKSVQDFVDPEAAASAERALRQLDEMRAPQPTEGPVPGEHQENPFFPKRS